MSRHHKTRAAVIKAKQCASVPLCEHGCNGCDECTDYDDQPDECPHCHGDGRDPDCDYLLPCPVCLGGA